MLGCSFLEALHFEGPNWGHWGYHQKAFQFTCSNPNGFEKSKQFQLLLLTQIRTVSNLLGCRSLGPPPPFRIKNAVLYKCVKLYSTCYNQENSKMRKTAEKSFLKHTLESQKSFVIVKLSLLLSFLFQ